MKAMLEGMAGPGMSLNTAQKSIMSGRMSLLRTIAMCTGGTSDKPRLCPASEQQTIVPVSAKAACTSVMPASVSN